jgi:hypothetical protein
MQRNFLGHAMLGLIMAGVVATLGLSYFTVQTLREGRRLQGQVKALTEIRKVLGGLIQESAEYSRKNPAIDPILEKYGIKKQQPQQAQPPRK